VCSCAIVWTKQIDLRQMKIDKTSFGTLEDGTPIDLYTLTNAKGVQAAITNWGGILVSLLVPDRDGKLEDVVLGFDALESYLTPTYQQEGPYFGALVGRYANRIARGHFVLDGREYQLHTNNGPNHLHGGKRGFDKTVWKASPFTAEQEVGLVLEYTSEAGEEGYPGKLAVQVTYSLSQDDALSILYEAHTDAPTVLNLTNHSYFNLAPHPLGDVLQHQLQLHASHMLPVDDSLIPTGDQQEVAGTPFDFTQPTPIGDRIEEENRQLQLAGGYDHCWVLSPDNRPLAPAASVYEPASGRRLEVLTTEPGIQFYTGNFLTGRLQGKEGTLYQKRWGFCLETQHFPDSPNQPQFPSVRLDPGQAYNSQTVYRFSVQ
jgi:aldose 1-epimerase